MDRRVPLNGLFESHLTVRDLDTAIAFYRGRLGLELAYRLDARRAAFFWIGGRGQGMLGLWETGSAPNVMQLHLAFTCGIQEVLEAPGRLRAVGIAPLGFNGEPVDEPVVIGWMPAASLYFRDPDGHLLEFLAMLPDPPDVDCGVVPYSGVDGSPARGMSRFSIRSRMIRRGVIMRKHPWLVGLIVLVPLLAGPGPGAAHAQSIRVSSVELVTGRAGFVDEVWDQFTMLGGGLRVRLTPRFALGPEFVYLDGARRSHALTLTASGTFDLVSPRPDRRVVPFLVFGAGLLRQTSVVGGGPGFPGVRSYTSGEGTVSGGAGVRVALSRHWTVAPDARIGYEPETRVGVAVAWRP